MDIYQDPALQAELAYRHERLVTSRGTRATRRVWRAARRRG
jgi:hypothetical protein